jgi:hypothetical protein
VVWKHRQSLGGQLVVANRLGGAQGADEQGLPDRHQLRRPAAQDPRTTRPFLGRGASSSGSQEMPRRSAATQECSAGIQPSKRPVRAGPPVTLKFRQECVNYL